MSIGAIQSTDNLPVYSEGKTTIVGKWINGKNIYRRIYRGKLDGEYTELILPDLSYSDIDEMINLRIMAKDSSIFTQGYCIPSYGGEASFLRVYLYKDTIRIHCGVDATMELFDYIIFLEYTRKNEKDGYLFETFIFDAFMAPDQTIDHGIAIYFPENFPYSHIELEDDYDGDLEVKNVYIDKGNLYFTAKANKMGEYEIKLTIYYKPN